MQALLLNLAIFSQADAALPPPPPPAPMVNVAPAANQPAAAVPGAQTTEELRNWLLARLVVDLSFDAQKSAEVKTLLSTMDEQQVQLLVAYYKERAAKRDQPIKQVSTTVDQQALDQATLNLQQLEAYRDHLKREFDLKVLNGYMNQNLLYQNMLNNQRLMYLNYGPYAAIPGFNASPYGGFGYAPWGFGGYGFGMPGYGTSMMYGSPYVGYGMGFY